MTMSCKAFTMTMIKKREDIVIVEADKGNTTVVLDRDEYDDKLMTMLKDTTTYVELKRDPTQKNRKSCEPVCIAIT